MRMPKKIRVYRTHTTPKSAATAIEPRMPASTKSSIEATPRYFTSRATT